MDIKEIQEQAYQRGLAEGRHQCLMNELEKTPTVFCDWTVSCEDPTVKYVDLPDGLRMILHEGKYVGWYVCNGKDTDVPAGWIPVTERLPETCGYPVLMVAVNKYGQKKIVKGFTNYECPVEFCTNEKEHDLCWHCWEVTHWMPLPEPPKGE